MSPSLPPRPAMSALTQTRLFFTQPFDLLSKVRAECGDIFTLRLLSMGHCVVLCSSQLLAELYTHDAEDLAPGAVRRRLFASVVGDQLSLGMDGEVYHERRRLLMPFFGGRRVKQHTATIRALTEDTIRGWSRGQQLSLQSELDRLALRVISRILFGDTEADAAERLLRRAGEFLATLKSPFMQARFLRLPLGPLTPWGRFKIARDRLFADLRQEIRARGDRDGDDLLSALIRSPLHEDPELKVEAIIQEMAGFLIGGAETTAKALGWTFLGLSTQPRLLNRLRQEIVDVLGSAPVRHQDLAKLPYLDAVIKEGLRWQPAAPLVGFREAKRDIEIGGFHIPKGHIVTQAFRETGRHRGFARPLVFDPEAHFLDRDVPMGDWLPFGGGQRMCIGMALAQLEMAVVLTTLLQCCDLELKDKTTRPQAAGISFQPIGGLEVRVKALSEMGR